MAGKAERRTEQITQLSFDTLAEAPADDAGAVPAGNKASFTKLPYPGMWIFHLPSHPEKADRTMTILRSFVLTHWENYHPTMLEQFKKENRLEAELVATTGQFSDLMYELVMVKKMNYQSAWEIAGDQFLLPEEEASLTNQNQNESLPGTSE